MLRVTFSLRQKPQRRLCCVTLVPKTKVRIFFAKCDDEGGMATDRYTRWRLILGKAANDGLCRMAGRSSLLDADQANLDGALGEIYGEGAAGAADSGGKKSPRFGGSAPPPAEWPRGYLGDLFSA